MTLDAILRIVVMLVAATAVGFGLREAGFDVVESAIGGAGAAFIVALAFAFNDDFTGYDPGR